MSGIDEKYEKLRLRNQPCFPVYLCAKELTRKYGLLLDRIGLTYTQYIVMTYLWETESSNVSDMGKTLLLDPSTLTPILKKLETKGYVKRERAADDERNLTVTPTDAGAALKNEALAVQDEMCGCLGLDEAETAALCTLTEKIIASLGKDR